MDFAKLIVYQAAVGPERPALAFTGGVATYRVLVGSAFAACERLNAAGFGPSSLVAVDVRNPFHHAVLLIALALRGAASVSVPNSFVVEEMGLKVDAVLHDEFARPAARLHVLAIDESWFDHDPAQPLPLAKLMGLPGMTFEQRPIRVVASSGTSGRPKSVGITPAVLGRRLANGSFTYGGSALAGSRVMSLMGFSTLPAFMSLFGTLAGGGVVCYAPNPAEALQIIQLFQVNVLALTPYQLNGLLEAHGTAAPIPSLQTMIVGGSRTSPASIAQARARICNNLMVGYGTTEAGSIAHISASAVEGLEDAAGFVLPWATLEAVDDDDRPLPAGETGRFRVRSNEMAGYVSGTVERFEPLADWFYPGDIGSIGADGMVFVRGRSAEVINRGGSIVSPDLVDEVLCQSPMVVDAAAFGSTNAAGIEEIWAAVVPSAGFDQAAVLNFCRARLADKAPERLVTVPQIPRNAMGKVMRHRLREEAKETRTNPHAADRTAS